MTAGRPPRWYAEFFGEEYWRFANVEYDSDRTRHEVAYLAEVLAAAPGRRVLDIGCGPGRHAIPLAQAGFEVVGVDVSAWAVDEATARAKQAGVEHRATFFLADVLAEINLPIGEIDAAIAVQSFGWGSDADQRRLLKAVRRHLAPGGLLVVDFSNVLWVTANYAEHAETDAGGRHFTFVRSYDAATGRSRGEVRITGGDTDIVLRDDVRLYTPAEMHALVAAAGFAVDRIDAEFVTGAEVTRSTRYAQVIARAAPVAPAALGLSTTAEPVDSAETLDLRWALDEWEWLLPSPRDVWTEVVGDGADALATARSYRLDDPFASNRGAVAVSAHLGFDVDPDQLVFGAGATALLRHAAELAEGGTVLAPDGTHPDLLAWARGLGCTVVTVALDDLVDAIEARHPDMVVIDRPGIDGNVLRADDVASLAEATAAGGGTLAVDESYANYLSPGRSAARLATDVDNLLVVRGLSKAYSWGGLRVGYAVASARQAARLRETLPPLQVAEIALAVALRLLEAGDVAAPLRSRLADVKPDLVDALRRLGLDVDPTHPALPWVLVDDGDELTRRGLAVKPLLNPGRRMVRVSVPLNDDRVERCMGMLR